MTKEIIINAMHNEPIQRTDPIGYLRSGISLRHRYNTVQQLHALKGAPSVPIH
jgi:hypothetical protein